MKIIPKKDDIVKAIADMGEAGKWYIVKSDPAFEKKRYKTGICTIVTFTITEYPEEPESGSIQYGRFVTMETRIPDDENDFPFSHYLQVRINTNGPGSGNNKTVVYDDPDDPDTYKPD